MRTLYTNPPRSSKVYSRCTGFIQLTLMGWAVLIVIGVISVLGVRLKIVTAQRDTARATIAQIKAVGEAEEVRRKKEKDRADADYKRVKSERDIATKRLRNSSSRSVLPDTGSTERACFDRPELDAALRKFTDGVAGLVIQGDEAVTGLDSAKRWSQGQ